MTSKYYRDVFVVTGRFLSVMGSCDRCSRTETCTSTAVICENLDYKFQILNPSKYSLNLICNIKDLMVNVFSTIKGPSVPLAGGSVPLMGPSVRLTGDPFP